MDLNSLLLSVPSFDEARRAKYGFREYPIDDKHALFNEPLVDIVDFGLAGQAYWSRPNSALDDPVKGVEPSITLRKTVAEKLKNANDLLSNDNITKLFGQEVELYIEDGLRTIEHQAYLYNMAFPEHIAHKNPKWSNKRVLARRDALVAKPPERGQSPSPHMTGGAVDITLRKKSTDKSFRKDLGLNLLRKPGSTDETCNPDYAEYTARINEYSEAEWREGVRNRRLLYNLLDGLGLQVNPTELWHWSYGDQMWAVLKNHPAAFYGLATID